MTEPSSATGTIVVGGTGRVSVQPDVAELRLGIAISRATVKEARARSSRGDGGRSRRDRRRRRRPSSTSGRPCCRSRPATTTAKTKVRADRLRPRQRRRGHRPRPRRAWPRIIDGALEAGATSLDGLTFRLEDPSEAERMARTSAVAVARARAEVLAEAAGVTIGWRCGHRRGRHASHRADAEGRPDVDRGRSATPVEAGDDGDRGQRHGHLPDRLTAPVSPWPTPSAAPRPEVGQVDSPVLVVVDGLTEPPVSPTTSRTSPCPSADGIEHPQGAGHESLKM